MAAAINERTPRNALNDHTAVGEEQLHVQFVAVIGHVLWRAEGTLRVNKGINKATHTVNNLNFW